MKTNKGIRILVVVVALSMLTGYVVYSQRQRTSRVAPSSKLKVLDELKESIALAQSTNVATKGQPATSTIAPGSKSFIPLIQVDSELVSTNADSKSRALMPGSKFAPVFPGSKSDVVFSPEDFKSPPKAETNNSKAVPPKATEQQVKPRQK